MGSERIGAVSTIGKKTIVGWAQPAGEEPRSVTLMVNGKPAMRTVAVQPTAPDGAETSCGFTFNVKHLWKWVGNGDVLSVQAGETLLPFAGEGEVTTYIVSSDRKSRAEGVFRKLDRGYVLDKYGAPRQPLAEAKKWQKDIFALFEKLRGEVREILGYELWITYGTLLGAVRSGDFIGNDNDFDTIYVSRQSEPKQVKEEYKTLCIRLQQKGYTLKLLPDHVQVHLGRFKSKKRAKLDIFYSWFDADGLYDISYGYHGDPVPRADDFDTAVPGTLAGRPVALPKYHEAILAQMYGPNWRTPDPGFSHYAGSRKRRTDFSLSPVEANEPYWEKFYAKFSLAEPSTFARFVAERYPAAVPVVEFGCGNGRDSLFFASLGHPIMAADLATQGIASASARAKDLAGTVNFMRCDVGERAEVEAVLAAARAAASGDQPLLVYMRFFLHSIVVEAERALLGALAAHLRPGDQLAVEFRTDKDKALDKVHGDHFRRYIEPDAFVERLEGDYGFAVDYRHVGQGLSVYKDEDPHLCRVLATKN